MPELLNPFERKLAAGMSPLVAFLSEATCGEACWEAREDICRCSCGGRNHGCMRSADGIRPERTAKIDGYRYKLVAVGHNDLYAEAKHLNSPEIAGYKAVHKINEQLTYRYKWDSTDKGAPARMKTATMGQIERWPELASFRCGTWEQWKREHPQTAYIEYPLCYKPYLLWKRLD